jgi:predicted phage baseplate assembly protein
LEEHFDDRTIRENAFVSEILGNNVIMLDRTLNHTFSSSSRILKKVSLDVLDGTGGLARSDSLVLTKPPDHLSTTHFGKSCTWIMGIWAKEKPNGISISSIFPNTAWAEQVETISDEIIGSSDGEKGQGFRFARSPVISPQLWVKEGSNVAEDDRQFIQSDGLKTSEVTDEDGKITDVWVLWKAVEDFYDSGPRNRHYMVDEALGRIYFGDGTRGMIPPIGTDNLRASYNTGGGLPGNIAAGEITTIKTPISGIDKVSNPLPADGGSDIEDLGSALERGPLFIKSLGRAVTEEDFESLAKESSSFISRTKCFTESDRLKVVVIPKSNVEKPMPSPGLLRVVREYLAKKMSATLYSKKFDVMGPSYREIRISATVVPRFRDDSVVLERMIIKALNEYLHPLWGGRDKAGWPFGRSIHISELYELLGSIDGVDCVDDLKINRSDRQKEIDKATIEIGDMEMVCSGEHSITMKGGAEK